MFVCNFKINKNKIFKLILLVMGIICISLAIVCVFKIFNKNNENINLLENNCSPSGDIAYLNDENYANILKEVHENLESYIGQKISYSGYVYRVPEIQQNQFILARDMKLENINQTVVVGFLCTSEKAIEFDTYTWVKITGTIEKGEYFGEIPCLNITEIEKCEEPENKIIPSPNENFIQTSVIY